MIPFNMAFSCSSVTWLREELGESLDTCTFEEVILEEVAWGATTLNEVEGKLESLERC
jgi:hypothetical protein